MLPIYKKIKVLMPHCPICKEQLKGNNSYLSPYECSCGVWISKTAENDFYFYPKY